MRDDVYGDGTIQRRDLAPWGTGADEVVGATGARLTWSVGVTVDVYGPCRLEGMLEPRGRVGLGLGQR